MTQAVSRIPGSPAALPGRGPGVAPSPWLYGRGVDVLLGYGLAYLLSVPLLVFLASRIDATSALAVATPYLALVFSTPHYGATILRVYEQREDRRKYALFSIWITLAFAALFAGGLYVGLIGSLLLTAYVTWSPWHFSGQNYGISVMYLRRLGIALDGGTKRLLYVSYLLSAILALISIHVVGATLVFAAGSSDPSSTFRVLQLGIPENVGLALSAVLGVGYLACVGAVGWRLSRQTPPSKLAPVALLAATQALWEGKRRGAPAPVRRSESRAGPSGFLTRSLLAGAARAVSEPRGRHRRHALAALRCRRESLP